MEIELKQGEKMFEGVLIEFSDVQGKSKKDDKPFHFVKFNVDLSLKDAQGNSYSRLAEFIADPSVTSGQQFEKYKKVYCIFDIVSPLLSPKLVRVIKVN